MAFICDPLFSFFSPSAFSPWPWAVQNHPPHKWDIDKRIQTVASWTISGKPLRNPELPSLKQNYRTWKWLKPLVMLQLLNVLEAQTDGSTVNMRKTKSEAAEFPSRVGPPCWSLPFPLFRPSKPNISANQCLEVLRTSSKDPMHSHAFQSIQFGMLVFQSLKSLAGQQAGTN